MTASCCAECGKEEEEGGAVTLKVCKACMLVKYCNAECQRKHWPIKKNVNYGPPSYATRHSSRTHHPRRTVPFASYLCRIN